MRDRYRQPPSGMASAFCRTVHTADVTARPGADDGRDFDTPSADGQCGVTRHRSRSCCRFRPPSCGAESQPLVGIGRRAAAARSLDRHVYRDGSCRRWPGRHDRTAMGREDQGAWHLSGSCPFQPRPFRQGEWPAMVIGDAAGSAAVVGARLGIALSHSPSAIGTIGAGSGDQT